MRRTTLDRLALMIAGAWIGAQASAVAATPPVWSVAAAGTPARPALTEVAHRTAAPMPRAYPVSVDVIRHRPMQRLQQLVRPELLPHFDLYLYVNKAPQGASAQHMFIFERLPNGNFHLRYTWPTSTGRERPERYFTTTPTGIYKLDPARFYTYYESRVWDGVPMPYAMFVDFAYGGGRMSGIAVHGTNSQRSLGARASGGCIRLAQVNAKMLFGLIQSRYAGPVPKFAWDQVRGHTSRTGQVRRSESGKLVMEHGYRVLLIVDNVQ